MFDCLGFIGIRGRANDMYQYTEHRLPLCNFPLPLLIYSSPVLKAQVNFSDHLLSVCTAVGKLFAFTFSSPIALGQIQPNLAQSILG